ncbi:retrotransposon protein, putative, ty1-copia subclass [Tanacetum coccineum]
MLKAKGKGKGKGKDKSNILKPKNPKPSAKERPAKDDACHHCKEVGHWKRNCPVYLAELIMKQKQVGTASNGVRAQVEAIGSYDLVLPNDLVICLDNCHYAPTITRGVVSVPHLVDNGFIQCFTNYGISVLKNDVLYFNAISSNGIYEINMINRVLNVNYIYNVSNKRVKHNLDFTYLWHCRLAHISKKRIEKLQHDGILKSTDEESLINAYLVYQTATRILNMVPTKKVDKTPTESWYGKVPNLSYLKETMGYYFYFPPENKIVVARFAEFLEKNLLSQEINGRAEELEEIQDEDTSPYENTSKIPMEV